MSASVRLAMAAMVRTASTGYLPAAVSPESITAEVPSYTALATSVISARVGRGLVIMLSSIWVAVITCLPMARVWLIRSFWITGISVKSISTPMSPRAIMMPSATARISSTLFTPSWFSSLAMMRMLDWCSSSRRRISITSWALRQKEAATKSNPS